MERLRFLGGRTAGTFIAGLAMVGILLFGSNSPPGGTGGIASPVGTIAIGTIKPSDSSAYNLTQGWNTTWTVGPDEDDSGSMVMYNGKLYATGYGVTYGAGVDNGDVWYACFDTSGNLEWNKTWHNNTYESGNDICVTGTAIYVGGQSYNSSSSNMTAFLLKCTMAGDLVWARSITKVGWTSAWINGLASNGTSVFACGGYRQQGHSDNDAFIVEYASNGVQTWNMTESKPTYDSFQDIIVDGTHIYIGGTHSSPMKLFFTALDKAGTPPELYEFGNQTVRAECRAFTMAGGCFYLAGSTNLTAATQNEDILLVKLAPDYSEAWNRTWHGFDRDYAYGVAVNGTNVYVAGGIDSATKSSQACVIRFDTSGNLHENISWGGDDSDWAGAMAIQGPYIYTLCGHGGVPGLDWEPYITRLTLNGPPAGTTQPPDDGALATTVVVIIIAAVGGGIVLLYVLDKKGVINLKTLFGKMRGIFSKRK